MVGSPLCVKLYFLLTLLCTLCNRLVFSRGLMGARVAHDFGQYVATYTELHPFYVYHGDFGQKTQQFQPKMNIYLLIFQIRQIGIMATTVI